MSFTNPLPPHIAQLEAGWAQEQVSIDTKNSFGLGVLRWGVANRVELRADIPTWFHAENGPKLDSGFGDAGGTWPLGRHFLVDVSAGTGVGGADDARFFGVGGTWRW